jgi:hypothetical protein
MVRTSRLPLILLTLCGGSAAAQSSRRELAVPRVGERPVIDGVLNEAMWQQAARLEHWVQTRPGDNLPAVAPTVAYLAYGPDALYLAVDARDAAARMRYRLHERDAVTSQGQDYISILIDTFNDRRRAFNITVNPLGIQGDGIKIEGGEFSEWDGVFDTAGKVGPDGYVIEIAIPFKSLRFPAAALQRWGLALTRVYGRDGMEDTPWPRNRDLECDLCQMIALTGLANLGTPRNVEVNPAVVGSTLRQRKDIARPFEPWTAKGQIGVNAKVGLSSGLTLDGTWNPDFSQVEADAGQLELNNRFALFFPEKRPFFLESTDILESRFPMPGQFVDFTSPPINLVYTRRIADPDGGARLTGKLGRVRLAAIAALDAAADYQFADPIGGLGPRALDPWAGQRVKVGVARGRVDVLADGFLGGTLTAREFGDGHQVTGAFDTRLRFGANTVFHFLGAASGTREASVYGPVRDRLAAALGTGPDYLAALDSVPAEVRDLDGEKRTGLGIQASLEYTGRHWLAGAGYEDITPGFETALGFTPRTDIALATARIENIYRAPGFLQEVHTRIRVEDGYAHARDGLFSFGEHTDFLLSPQVDVYVAGPSDFGVGYSRYFIRFDGVKFSGLDRWYAFLDSQAIRQLGLSTFIRWGEEVIYQDEVDQGPPLPNYFVSATASAALRPLSALRLEWSLAAARVWRRSATEARESRYGESAIPRLKALWQLTPHLGLRLIGEYRYERFYRRSGDLALKRDALSTEALATYLVHPGQSIQAGWSQLAEGDLDTPLRSSRRGGIAKVSYLWRF